MNIFKILNNFYTDFQLNPSKNVDPQLVKYFRTEYGQDWQSALTEHLYKKESDNDKKAA